MPPRARTTTAPAPDPLADLRAPETDPGLTAEPAPEIVKVRPTAGADFHAEARAEIVAAFHTDTVATGMLHKGGTCGCRYLAALALRTALGAPQEPDEPEGEDEDAEGDSDG
jgi:hypothetical protein